MLLPDSASGFMESVYFCGLCTDTAYSEPLCSEQLQNRIPYSSLLFLAVLFSCACVCAQRYLSLVS